MNRSILILCIYLLINVNLVYAGDEGNNNVQTKEKNSVEFGLFGDGLNFSVNYGRNWMKHEKYFYTATIGIGYILEFFTLPHQFTINIGKERNYFECGIGGTYIIHREVEAQYYYLNPIAGYRYNANTGFLLRIYACPLIKIGKEALFNDYRITPFLGINIGYAF